MAIARVVLLAAVLVSACTPPRPPATPSPPGPAPTGTVKLGYPYEPPTLNPVAPSGASLATRDVLRPVLPALFRLDEKLRPQPELAAALPSSKEISLDPFAVTLRLRRAQWSDGVRITSTDVRFSWERLRGGPSGNRYRFVRDVEIQSPIRFRIVFDRPVRRWWALFSIDDMVLPAHAFSDAWDRAPTVSGGPFLVEGWTPGLGIRLRRNDDYWGERAGVAAIEVVFVADDEARLQLLSRAELEVAFAEGESNIGARAKARGAPATSGALDARRGASSAWASAWWELDLDVSKVAAPVAEAVARGLDRRLVVELFDDSGQVIDGLPARFPVDGPQSFGTPGIPGPWPAGGELDAAREILRKAGYRRSGADLLDPRRRAVEIVLAFAEAPTPAAIARLIHFRLRELGVRVEIVPIDAAAFERDWVPNRRAGGYLLLRRGSDVPDASAYRGDAPAARNPARAQGADAAIDAAETQIEPARLRGALVTGYAASHWAEAQRQLIAGHAVLPLVRLRSWLVSRGGVAGPHATGSASGPLWNAAKWRPADVA